MADAALATTDYEKEYDNRGRVPEHPEIFARWERDGAAYRDAAHGEYGLKYGPGARQSLDFFPAKDKDAPLALFIHGGWWRSLDPSLFSPAAVTLTSTESGRAHHGGGLAPDVLERSFTS